VETSSAFHNLQLVLQNDYNISILAGLCSENRAKQLFQLFPGY